MSRKVVGILGGRWRRGDALFAMCHIMLIGINKREFFLNKADYRKFRLHCKRKEES